MPALPWLRHRKKDIPGDLWVRCPNCDETIYSKDLDERRRVCPKCEFHHPISSHTRIAHTLDPATFQEVDGGLETIDALGFSDTKSYPEKLAENSERTGLKEAMRYGVGRIGGRRIVFGVLDFGFLGGSMGVVVGEKVTRAVELAMRKKLPLVLIASSGGARMHEGILSLMQMAKTCAVLAKYRDEGGFYISVCSHPTTGGVTASWAMAADVIIAESGALIGFAGPRVIEETIKKSLPSGFQSAEFLLERGQIDAIIPRYELREALERLLSYSNYGRNDRRRKIGPEESGAAVGKDNQNEPGEAQES